MPSIPANLDWLFLTIGGLLALGSLCLLFWSLFRDRARATFRCPKCWYDLTPPDRAPPPLPITCSECGRTITKPKHLRKRRRRYRYALLAIVLFLTSGVIACYPHARRDGLVTIVPTWFLIDSMPVFGYPSLLTDELLRRDGRTMKVFGSPRPPFRAPVGLSLEEQTYLVRRIGKGNLLTGPISEQWRRTFGAYRTDNLNPNFDVTIAQRSAQEAALMREIWRLYDIPPFIDVRTRSVWSRENRVFVSVEHQTWWPVPCSHQIAVRDLRSGEVVTDLAEGGFWFETEAGAIEETRSYEVTVRWQRFGTGDSEGWEHRWDKTFTIAYRHSNSISSVFSPVVDPTLDKLIALLPVSLGSGITLDLTRLCIPTTQGIAFGVIVEYYLESELHAVQRLSWLGGPLDQYQRRPSLLTIESVPDARLENRVHLRQPWTAHSGENWTVRIRSDPETALRVIDADKYWQGDVTIPLTIR